MSSLLTRTGVPSPVPKHQSNCGPSAPEFSKRCPQWARSTGAARGAPGDPGPRGDRVPPVSSARQGSGSRLSLGLGSAGPRTRLGGARGWPQCGHALWPLPVLLPKAAPGAGPPAPEHAGLCCPRVATGSIACTGPQEALPRPGPAGQEQRQGPAGVASTTWRWESRFTLEPSEGVHPGPRAHPTSLQCR